MNENLPILLSFFPIIILVIFFAFMWWKDFGFTKRGRTERSYAFKSWQENRQRHNSKTFDRLRDEGKDVAKGDYLRTDIDAYMELEEEKARQERMKEEVIRENARL